MQKFMISTVGKVEVVKVEGGESFIAAALGTPEDENIMVAFHPAAANALAITLLRELDSAANDGTMALLRQPTPETNIHGEATPTGIYLQFDRPDTGLRLGTSLTLEQADQLKTMLERLVLESRDKGRQLN
jgi:hypothetical protein